MAMASAINFANNELITVYRIQVERKIKSAALVANSLHARTNKLTSLTIMASTLSAAAD